MGSPSTIMATNNPAGNSDAASTVVKPVGKCGVPKLNNSTGKKNPHAPATRPNGAMPSKSTPDTIKSGQMKCDITTAPPQIKNPRCACDHSG